MKRIYSFFAIALFVAITYGSHAQTVTMNISSMQGIVTKTIVRETVSARAIIYYETAAGHYFAYCDGSTSAVTSVPININYSVNDFVISNDSVFFCGNTNASQGFFGHFDIQDFFYNTHTFYTASPFNSTFFSTIKSFDKMVTYTESGIRMLAAVGHDINDLTVVIEVRYTLNTPSIGYNVGSISNSNEEIYDIALTDNYVVTAGFANISGVGNVPSVRVYKRGSLFQNGGPQDTVAYFSKYGSQTVAFNNTQLVLSQLQGDDFALAAYWRNLNSTTDTGTFVSLHSIATNHDVLWTSSMVTTQFHHNGGWQLHGLTPMDNSSYFYLLQTAEIANLSTDESLLFMLTPSMFSLAPYGGTMTVKQMVRPQLTSIDAKAGNLGFVSCGINYTYPDNMVCCLSMTNSPGCSNDRIMPIYPIDMVGSEQHHAFQLYSSTVAAPASNIGTPIMLTKDVFCNE